MWKLWRWIRIQSITGFIDYTHHQLLSFSMGRTNIGNRISKFPGNVDMHKMTFKIAEFSVAKGLKSEIRS
jgi:hypothetical protein